MKNPFRISLAALALVAAAAGLQAQPAVKVITVDMQRLLQNFHETEAFNVKMQADVKKAEEQLNKDGLEIKAIEKELSELVEQMNNPILIEEARKKASADANAKNQVYMARGQQFQANRQAINDTFQDRIATFQRATSEKISKIATELAKKKGATLVLNKAAPVVVIYSDPAYEITEEVLVELNKDRPAPAITINPAQPAK